MILGEFKIISDHAFDYLSTFDMERVTTLIEKLQKQLEEKVPVQQLLYTVQMLHGELLLQNNDVSNIPGTSKVMVLMPSVNPQIHQNGYDEQKIQPVDVPEIEEKIVEVLQVDEKEIEEELNEIKRNAEAKNQMSSNARPVLLFDPIEDVPTLTHQTPLKKEVEINVNSVSLAESVNDRLKETKIEMSDKLTDSPIKDLKKAIGINDRFLFINELFRGDEAMYERSIKTINNFSIMPEAQYWIQRELKLKIGWNDGDEVVRQFDQLVRRRFS